MRASNIWYNIIRVIFTTLLYSKWNVGDLNIPEKSEFGHILIQDYFIYGSCIIFKNNLIYLYSSQYWGSGGWLICPKPQSWDKAELNENTISGSAQVPSHKTSMPSFSRLARWLSWGILNTARTPGWDDHEATKRLLIQPRHLPTGNEPSGFWKPFLNILCYYGSCLPQGKCMRHGEDWGKTGSEPELRSPAPNGGVGHSGMRMGTEPHPPCLCLSGRRSDGWLCYVGVLGHHLEPELCCRWGSLYKSSVALMKPPATVWAQWGCRSQGSLTDKIIFSFVENRCFHTIHSYYGFPSVYSFQFFPTCPLIQIHPLPVSC